MTSMSSLIQPVNSIRELISTPSAGRFGEALGHRHEMRVTPFAAEIIGFPLVSRVERILFFDSSQHSFTDRANRMFVRADRLFSELRVAFRIHPSRALIFEFERCVLRLFTTKIALDYAQREMRKATLMTPFTGTVSGAVRRPSGTAPVKSLAFVERAAQINASPAIRPRPHACPHFTAEFVAWLFRDNIQRAACF